MIEAFVVDQIKRIGADPALCGETFRQVQARVATERRGLKAEANRVGREIPAVRLEVDRLTTTITRAVGAATDALLAKLAETQKRLMTLECRRRDLDDRVGGLSVQDIDPDTVGGALKQFTDVWELLLTPERERMIRLVIERIDYDGPSGEVKFTFSPLGVATLVTSVTSEVSAS
jgi:site-specific DNA recombinase